jgi:WD40 repeat protein
VAPVTANDKAAGRFDAGPLFLNTDDPEEAVFLTKRGPRRVAYRFKKDASWATQDDGPTPMLSVVTGPKAAFSLVVPEKMPGSARAFDNKFFSKNMFLLKLTEPIWSVRLDPSGRRWLAVNDRGDRYAYMEETPEVWVAAPGPSPPRGYPFPLPPPDRTVRPLSFDATGRRLVVASRKGLLIYDLGEAGGELPNAPRELPLDAELRDWDIAPVGSLVACVTSDHVFLADLADRRSKTVEPVMLKAVAAGPPLRSVGFSPGGSRLAVGDDSGCVSVEALEPGRTDRSVTLLRLQHGGPILVVRFSPNGRLLAVLTRDGAAAPRQGTIRLWKSEGWDTRALKPLR